MKKYLLAMVVVLSLTVPEFTAAGDYDTGVKSTIILKTTTTTGGYPVKYLKTENPEITAAKVEIAPGAETGWHSHSAPLYAYVLEGDLSVEVKGGEKYLFRSGDAIVEVVDIPHNGKNLGHVPVVLIVFYTGEKGTPNTIKMPAVN